MTVPVPGVSGEYAEAPAPSSSARHGTQAAAAPGAEDLLSPQSPGTTSLRSPGDQPDPAVRALLVLNVQNDYFRGGSFPIAGAESALRTINQLRLRRFDVVFVCSTHRPPNFVAFASNNPGTRLHEAALLNNDPQLMWPDHCVEGTYGANFHPDLVIDPSDVLTSTGHDPHSVVHSAFGREHRQGSTSLLERLLRERGVTELFLAGLSTDYGILYTALDARLLVPHIHVRLSSCIVRQNRTLSVDCFPVGWCRVASCRVVSRRVVSICELNSRVHSPRCMLWKTHALVSVQ